MLVSRPQRSPGHAPWWQRSFKRAALAALAGLLAASCLLDPKSDDLPSVNLIGADDGTPTPEATNDGYVGNPTDSPPRDGESLGPDNGGIAVPPEDEGSADGADAGTATTLATPSSHDAGAATLSATVLDAGAADGIESSEEP